MEDHAVSTCIICGEHKEDGIFVVSEFICTECESEIVQTDVQDEKYPFFIHQLKQIWIEKNA